eukprot:contig_32361_g7868
MTSLASAEKRVARAFDTSDWYAAEQAVRALYHRQATGARKEAPAPPAVAAATLRSGAARLLAAGQITAGTSIALLLVEHWASGGPVGGGRGAAAAGGPGRVPYGSGGSDEALLALADAYGDPADLDESGRRDGPAYGDGNLADAKVVRDEFVAGVSWPTAEYGSPAAPPLANFCTLTLAAAARGRAAAPLWATLRQTYAASLGRDPSLERLLVAVGQAWFGVEPPRPPGGGGGVFGGR